MCLLFGWPNHCEEASDAPVLLHSKEYNPDYWSLGGIQSNRAKSHAYEIDHFALIFMSQSTFS